MPTTTGVLVGWPVGWATPSWHENTISAARLGSMCLIRSQASAARNGGFLKPFDPWEVNNHFTGPTVGNIVFMCPTISKGIWALGKSGWRADSLFSAPRTAVIRPILPDSSGNIPARTSHHILFVPCSRQAYQKSAIGERHTRHALSRYDGLSGNEDCGQMSAWYVMASLGLYQWLRRTQLCVLHRLKLCCNPYRQQRDLSTAPRQRSLC